MSSKETRAAVADRLREARELAGLSQGQVARLLGIHRPTVTEIEAGRRRVAAEELAQLADIYEVDASWLLGSSAEPSDSTADRVKLAARELQKLTPNDLDRVMSLVSSLQRSDPS